MTISSFISSSDQKTLQSFLSSKQTLDSPAGGQDCVAHPGRTTLASGLTSSTFNPSSEAFPKGEGGEPRPAPFSLAYRLGS